MVDFSGLSNQQATLAQVGIGVVKVLSTIASLRVVDHQGRRKLLIGGTIMMIVSLFIFASVSLAFPAPELYSNFTEAELAEDLAEADAGRRWRRDSSHWGPAHVHKQRLLHAHTPWLAQDLMVDQFVDPSSTASSSEWADHALGRSARSAGGGHHREGDTHGKPPIGVFVATVLCLGAFVIAYAFSYGPVSWLVLSEIFPDDIRGRAVSIATIFNWTSNLVVASTFLTLLGTCNVPRATCCMCLSIRVTSTFFLLGGTHTHLAPRCFDALLPVVYRPVSSAAAAV